MARWMRRTLNSHSAELQQLEPNGRDGGIGELAVAQTDAAQEIDENIG